MAQGPIPSVFRHREDSLCTRLGVDRSWFRQHRHPQARDVKWALGPNRVILWSDDGVLWLARKLENSAPPASPDARPGVEKGAPLSPPSRAVAGLLPERCGAVAVLVVTRTKFINPRVMQARTPWGQIVTVTGVKPALWWPGFLLQARENSRDVWEFECNPEKPESGRRQPRGRTDPVWPRSTGGPASH